MKKIFIVVSLFILMTALTHTVEAAEFHYNKDNVDSATYFTSITNLANAIMFSDFGEPLIISPYERDNWLRRAGYVTRPPMPDMGIVGPVYAAAIPEFKAPPDFSKPETLRWKTDTFDRTLDPGAQAWTLLKITSPQFHLQFHDLPENRIAALMMIPQARTLAKLLEKRLRNANGLFAAMSPDGKFLDPEPQDQAAALWAVSNLILASTSKSNDYWHKAYKDLVDADNYRLLASYAFSAVEKLQPNTATDRAIAIEALGSFALATNNKLHKKKALNLAREHADALLNGSGASLENISMAVYGLIEAGRMFGDASFTKSANNLFHKSLIPLWDEDIGVFREQAGSKRAVYTTRTAGAVIAALNAMRWYGPEESAKEARRIYPVFFENAVIRSGMLRASPLPLVSKKYLEAEPASSFAHPILPLSKEVGFAPVFVSEVAYLNGKWKVTDPKFKTEGAMFLANMLAVKSNGNADTFLPEALLKELR